MQTVILLMFISFFAGGFQLFAIGTYGVTILDVLTLLFYVIFLKKVLWDGDKLIVPVKLPFFFLSLLLAVSLLSGLVPVFSGSSNAVLQCIKTTAHFIFLILFSIICSFYTIDTKIWNNVIKTWLILGIFINLFGAYQIFARAYGLPLAWIQYSNISLLSRATEMPSNDVTQLSLHYGDFFRATSIFSEPSALATFNIYLLIFIFIPWVQNRENFFKSKFLMLTCFITTMMGLLITFSMTAFLGIFLIFISVLLFEKSRSFKGLLKGMAIGIVTVLITDAAVSSYTNISVIELFEKRIQGIMTIGSRNVVFTPGESFGGRIESGIVSLEIWEENPIFGTGLGLTYLQGKRIGFSDFSILAVMAELGIFGLIAFSGMFLSLAYITLKYIRKKNLLNKLNDNEKRLAGLLFYIIVLQIEINFFTGNNLVVVNLWLPIALVFSVIHYISVVNREKNYSFSLTNIPFKEHFYKSLNKVLSSSIKKTA